MTFNTLTYILFLAIVVTTCWVAPRNYFKVILFFASALFYGMWHPEYLILLFFSICMDYLFGIGIATSKKQSSKKAMLVMSIIMNIGMAPRCFKWVA